MNLTSYYDGARAFLAFDAFMVLTFTVTQVGLAFALPHGLVRLLAAVWGVHAVRVIQRAVYFSLDDRLSPEAWVMSAVFAATCVLPLILIRRATQLRDTETAVWPAHLWAWAAAAMVVGGVMHGVTATWWPDSLELASAIWTRVFALLPLALMLHALYRAPKSNTALRPLFWGIVAQTLAVGVDSIVRVRSFSTGLDALDVTVVASMTLASTLFVGLGSLLASVEYERQAMLVRSVRLRQAQNRAIESERWQQVGQLARGVAHDFNNVLGVVMSGSDLVEDSILTRNPHIDGDLDEIDHAVERGRSLTQRLQRFAHRQPHAPRAVRTGQVGRELLPMLKRLASREREVRLDATDEQLIRIDPTALEQILLNLVANARDATESGGRIALRIADVILTESQVAAVGALPPGPYVRLSVEDNGSGMPPDVIERLWEPFFTTKGERGSGIGLPTVAAAATEAGGAIVVESTEQVGSRFHVWLPATASEASAA